MPVLGGGGDRGGPRTIRKSKNGRRRAAVLIGVHVLFIAHLAHWKIAGRTISPVEPSEAMYSLEQGMINAGLIFFALALLATLVFGRFMCGWLCHMVAMQDLCGWMMKKIGVRPKPFRSRLLVYVPLLLGLYMFVWPSFRRLALAPTLERMGWDAALAVIGVPAEFPGFSNHLVTEGFWDTFAPWPVAIPFLLICGFATVYFLGAKGFCTYGCPYGGLFAPVEQLAPGRIIVDPDKCHQCGHCTAVCTSNVRVHDEVREFGMVVNPGCMKCMDCVSVCPNDALSFGFAKPAVVKGAAKHAPIRRKYDMSWGEEVAIAASFALAFVAWRGVYGVVPMLMAVGMAGCLAFVWWKAWRVLRSRDVRIIGAQLKRAGRIRRGGGVFLFAAVVAAGLTAHSLVLRIERWRGDAIDGAVTVTKAAAIAQTPGGISEEMRSLAERGLKHYRRAFGVGSGGWGIADQPEALARAAWLHTVRGERDEAIKLLKRLDDRIGYADVRAVDTAQLLAFAGREAEAVAHLENVLDSKPRFAATRELLVAALLSRGDVDGAIGVRRGAVDEKDWNKPRQAAARASLASLLMQAGRIEEGAGELAVAVELAPTNATYRNDFSVALFLSGRQGEAVEQMRRAAYLDPANPQRWDFLARMLEQIGRTEEAAAARAEGARRVGDQQD